MKSAVGVTSETQIICTANNRCAMIVGVREPVSTYADGVLSHKDVSFVTPSNPTNQVVCLTFSNDYVVNCGKDTEFLMKDKTFKRCSDIAVGDDLYTTDGSSVKLREFSFYHGDGVILCRPLIGGYCGVELSNHTFVRIGE